VELSERRSGRSEKQRDRHQYRDHRAHLCPLSQVVYVSVL
jgi:hypothetical protein